MARRVRKKSGTRATILRVVVLLVLTAIFGLGSFFGSKTFFLSRLEKDEKEKIAEQLKKESKEHVDVSLVSASGQLSLRIYHNQNKQMIYVPLQNNTELTLNSDGQEALDSAKTATVAQLLEATDDMELVMAQVEETLGIDIGEYEKLSDSKLVKAIDNIGEVEVDIPTELSYRDQNDMRSSLSEGTETLNGNQVLAILSEDTEGFDSESDRTQLRGEVMASTGAAMSKLSASDYKQYVKDYFSLADCNYKYSDVSEYVERMQTIDAKDYTYQILKGEEDGDVFKLDADDVGETFDALLSEGVTATEESTTEKATTEKTTESSKDISIEIQNSTNISGLAGSWKDKLSEEGYTIGSVLTNSDGALTHTKIIVAKDGMGEDLKSYFKNPTITVGSVDSGAQICIIIGTEDEI